MENVEQSNCAQDNREVFISYHTNSGGEVVRKICAALEGTGIKCWYAPRNVGANYAQSIVEAIRGCRVFLLVLNKESNLSGHVLNEINCAFDRFRNHEDIVLLPFRIDNCALSDDVYYYLGRIHIMDGSLPPEVLRIRELVDRISSILGKGAVRTVTLSSDNGIIPLPAAQTASGGSHVYRLTGSMVYPDSRFVGRTKELAEIYSVLSGVENKLFLVGMGGIGKSEIARMHIKQHQNDYDVILWVSFDTSIEQTLINDYAFPIRGLSRTAFPEDSDQAYFQRKLRVLKEITDRRILIVMDNFDVTDDPQLEAFCSGSYTVIFTTRYHQENRNFPEIYVREMTDESDLLELFKAEYSRNLDETALGYVKNCIRRLNGHTLSIRLVASTMQHRRIAPEKMSALLKGNAVTMSKENARAADMIFGQLKEVFHLSALDEDEQYLLKNLALIPLRGISVETLYDWCGADEFDVIDGLIKKSWVIHNPVTDEVHLHPLLADLFQEKLTEDPESCSQLLAALLNAVENVRNSKYEWRLQLLDIATTACSRMPAEHPMRRQMKKACSQMYYVMDNYPKAIAVLRELKTTAQSTEELLYVCHKLSHIEMMTGNPSESRKIAQEGYALVENVDPDTLSMESGYLYVELLHRLAESNRDLKDYETSAFYGRKAAAFEGRLRNVAGSTKQSVWGWSEYHLALTLCMKGELDESERLIRHAIALFEEVSDLWAASFSYDILGQVQMRRGLYEDALASNQHGRDLLLPMHGEEHRNIATNLEWRGRIFGAMGETGKAVDCYARAAAIYQKLNLVKREEKVLEELRAVKTAVNE